MQYTMIDTALLRNETVPFRLSGIKAGPTGTFFGGVTLHMTDDVSAQPFLNVR